MLHYLPQFRVKEDNMRTPWYVYLLILPTVLVVDQGIMFVRKKLSKPYPTAFTAENANKQGAAKQPPLLKARPLVIRGQLMTHASDLPEEAICPKDDPFISEVADL